MCTFLSNICSPACLFAPISVSSTKLFDESDWNSDPRYSLSQQAPSLLSPTTTITIFFLFYISKDGHHARLHVLTALLMQILFFWDMTRCRVVQITNTSEWPAASFFRTTKLRLRYTGPVAPMGFRSAYSALVGNLAERRLFRKYMHTCTDSIRMGPVWSDASPTEGGEGIQLL